MKKTERASMLLGWVEFSGIGGFQEAFISDLLQKGVRLKKVSVSGGRLSGIISPLDYRIAASVSRRYGVRIRAGRRKGLYFTALRYSRRAGLYAGLMAFFVILSIGKATVADIRITGNAPEAQIIQILEECGITRGVASHGLDLSRAERRILLEVDDVAWVDVSVSGSRVSVTVEEAVPMPEILAADVPCNLVATRDAMIVQAVVRKGTLITQVGSGVQRGGLIVSGTIADGGEHLLYRHASADIIGEFTETQEFFIPYSETIRIPDGEKTEYKYLVFQDDVYPLFFGKAYMEDALYTEYTEIPQLFRGTPISIRTGVFTKYRDVDITRSDDDCLAEFRKQKSAFEENFYSEYEIISAIEKCFPEEGGIRFEIDYTLRGNIAEEMPIEVDLSQVSDITEITE